MKVRIHNDGVSAYRTTVTNVETGEDIEYVTGIEIQPIGLGDDMIEAVLTIALPRVDIVANAEIKHVCPYCGREEDHATST